MPYYDNPGTSPDEAINIVNGKVFNVVQLADSSGNVVDPGGGGGSNDALDSIDSKTPNLINGRVPVETFSPSRTPTTTRVASSLTSVTILASNSNRRGFSISNISTSKLYLSFSTPATINNCFIEVPAGAFILLDQQLIITNAIYGLWSSVDGAAQVTEYV